MNFREQPLDLLVNISSIKKITELTRKLVILIDYIAKFQIMFVRKGIVIMLCNLRELLFMEKAYFIV